MVAIDTANTMFAPAFTGIFLYLQDDVYNKNYLKIPSLIGISQAVIFLIGIFVTRVSEARSQRYINFMPEFAFCLLLLVFYVLPLAIIFSSIWTRQDDSEEKEMIVPFVTFLSFS